MTRLKVNVDSPRFGSLEIGKINIDMSNRNISDYE